MNPAATRAPRVIAVVVAYRPESALFSRLLAALDTEAAATVIVDNAQGEGLEEVRWRDRLERIDMKGNAGVGAAQNAGIRRAIDMGATHILVLDHDSVPVAGMTALLLAASQRLEGQGRPVAAVGADYRDLRHADSSPFVVMGRWGFRRAAARADGEPVEVSFLISAGSLIGVDAIAAVGLMDEQLFIDYVDVEWCLRAVTKGRHCFGVPGARLEHRLGDDVLGWGQRGRPIRVQGRTFATRSPLRHYYMFRNACWLVLRGTLPLRWKLLETKRLAACFAAYALFASHRRRQVRAMTRGALDGIRGRMGPVQWREPQLP